MIASHCRDVHSLKSLAHSTQKNSNAFTIEQNHGHWEHPIKIVHWNLKEQKQRHDKTAVPIASGFFICATENSCTFWCNQVPRLRNAIWEKPTHSIIARSNRIFFHYNLTRIGRSRQTAVSNPLLIQHSFGRHEIRIVLCTANKFFFLP